LPELKVIEDDDTMTEAEKTQAFMEKIFGPRPEKVGKVSNVQCPMPQVEGQI